MCRGTLETIKPGGKGEQSPDLCRDLREGALLSGVQASMSLPPHLWMWQRVFREKHMQHSFAFHCVCKNCSSQKGGDKWWCVAESARSHYAALIYSVWDFDLNAGVCVLQTLLASLSEEFPHPSNSNEPTSLVIDSFSDNKVMCVLLSNNDKRSRSPPRSLPKMHLSCHTHCPTVVLISSVRCCEW